MSTDPEPGDEIGKTLRLRSEGQEKPDVTEGGYRWSCPFCGTSRLNSSDGERAKENSIAALRSHIIASDGTSHGPRNEFPPDAPLTLSDHVSAVVDRR